MPALMGGGVQEHQHGSWAAINHVTNLAVFALAIDPTNPSTLYAGTTGGVFKSTDMGVSRAAINHVTNLAVFALAIDPTNPSTFYAGTTFGGVFKHRHGSQLGGDQ